MRSVPLCWAALALLPALVTFCPADPATVTFRGNLIDVDPALAGHFALGDVMTVTVTYDPTCPDGTADPALGTYDCISVLDLSVAGYTAAATDLTWRVRNDYGTSLADQISIFAHDTPAGGTLTGADLGSMSIWQLFVQLHDNSGTALSSDALPTTFLPEDFNNNQLKLIWRDGSTNYGITANIVPVPSAALLALLGLATAGRRLRRRSATASRR